MTAITIPAAEHRGLDQDLVRVEVDGILDCFLTEKARTAAAQRMPAEVTAVLRGFLAAGGKRIRPLLCVTGWQAAGGQGLPRSVVQVAASLEMFHAFCLIHDDVMDESDTRRGHPTVHRAVAAHHTHGRTGSAADQLGNSAAVLIGDLALAWSDELLHTAGLTRRQLADVLPLIDTMRTEVMYGQYLDVTTAGAPTDDIEHALAVCRYKTAKYTIERPLHLGAALTDASQPLLEALSAYAVPLGEAFQLRDDLLGVFGAPDVTGKPVLDDLREGKATVLIAHTLQRAHRAQADQLRLLLGCPTLTESQAKVACRIIQATSAHDTVNHMIEQRYETALAALDTAPIQPAAADALRRLADEAVRRST
ncbi:polyprenyl synthetase family protein [Streptomyces sp. NBC_00690]|uniref:polyprenyl synthetase family protein n=1 Tax=Streptomyces sp. NBC_00690 TaxID=2975808 RepID=UPI002E2A706B|nr:polyprenyl synthetase family protein [Streptomyces sp. NBC_00690]